MIHRLLDAHFDLTLLAGMWVQLELLRRLCVWAWRRRRRRRRRGNFVPMADGSYRVRWSGDVEVLMDVCRRRWPRAQVINCEHSSPGVYRVWLETFVRQTGG